MLYVKVPAIPFDRHHVYYHHRCAGFAPFAQHLHFVEWACSLIQNSVTHAKARRCCAKKKAMFGILSCYHSGVELQSHLPCDLVHADESSRPGR